MRPTHYLRLLNRKVYQKITLQNGIAVEDCFEKQVLQQWWTTFQDLSAAIPDQGYGEWRDVPIEQEASAPRAKDKDK
jgi:hypothetical protein